MAIFAERASARCTRCFIGPGACRSGKSRSAKHARSGQFTTGSTEAWPRSSLNFSNIERIEEPAPAPTRFGKVYIDGIGYMRDGRRLRDGREKADAKQLYETGLRGTEAGPDASYNKPCRA